MGLYTIPKISNYNTIPLFDDETNSAANEINYMGV